MPAVHMALLVRTVEGRHLPETYSLCGVYGPPVLTTDEHSVTCQRCLRSERMGQAKLAAEAAPRENLFGPTKRENLQFLGYY